jgi:transcriptional regulator
VVEDLHLGHDAPGVDNEVAQELELGGGQVDLDSGACHFVGVLVNNEVTDTQEGVVLLGTHGAAQDGAYAGDDLFEAEGLGDVVVAADR